MMKKLVTLIFIICLTGCSTTGGTIGGLFPAPKFTKGKISDGTYTSPKKEFSISVPNWDDQSEYIYMQIKENISETGQYLSFGPAVSNQNIYRVEFSLKNPTIPVESIKHKLFNDSVSEIENAYGSRTQLISEKSDLFSGKQSISRVYKQHTPEKPVGFSSIRPETVYYHAMDIVDYGTHGVFFWVEIRVDPPGDDSIEKALVNGTYPEHVNFVNSFKLLTSDLTLQYKIKDPIFLSLSNEFQFTMPFEPGQCIENLLKEEYETEKVVFNKCNNSTSVYSVWWYTLDHSVTAEEFYKNTEDEFIPDLLEVQFKPGKPAVLTSSERTYINSIPSVVFTSDLVRGETRFYYNAVIMIFGDRMAYIASVSDEKREAFQNLLDISNSIKRMK